MGLSALLLSSALAFSVVKYMGAAYLIYLGIRKLLSRDEVRQEEAAQQTGTSEYLLAAANTSGGVLGKMVSPQNLAVAAAVVSLEGHEGDLFRRVVLWSLSMLLVLCVVVFLQSSGVLGWMVVRP